MGRTTRANKIELTTSNVEEKNIILQEISGQLYVNNHLVLTSNNIGDSSNITSIESDITTLQSDVSTLQGSSGESSEGGSSSYSNAKSCFLDGSNDDLYLDSAISLSGAFTISFWFKHVSGNFPYLVGGYLFAYGAAYGNSILVRNVGTITSTGAYSENTWFNVVLKRDGSNNVELFVDGTSKGTSTHSGSITIQQFGRNGSNDPLHGYFDECAIWTSALSDTDRHGIRGGVAAGTKGSPADLSALGATPDHWWRCGDLDDTGTTSEDQGSASAVDMQHRNGASFISDIPS